MGRMGRGSSNPNDIKKRQEIHTTEVMEDDTLSKVRQKWASASPSSPRPNPNPYGPKLEEKRKQFQHIITWKLYDDKHRQLPDIKTTVEYLLKICTNVKAHPDVERYRRIRIANPTFAKNIRNIPHNAGEEYLIGAGWHSIIQDHEGFFVYDHAAGAGLDWNVLNVACEELERLNALLSTKLERAAGEGETKKSQDEARRLAARAALEEDRERRHARFTYGS